MSAAHLAAVVFIGLLVLASESTAVAQDGINQTAGGLTVSPRNHTYAKHMSELGDDELRLAIAEGGDAVQKSDLMPPWGKTISAEEIDELVHHLRTLCKCEGPKVEP